MRLSIPKQIAGAQRNFGRCRASSVCFALLPVCCALTFVTSCHRSKAVTIALIPRTTATPRWEAEHLGAKAFAARSGTRIYWNAPTREDDVVGQIALVEKISSGDFQGLVLAPDNAQALITPIRRALRRGLPVAVVGSPLSIPPGGQLCYILNDEEMGGRIAAQRLGAMLHGEGTIALLGVNPAVIGILTRVRSLEQALAQSYPKIRIVVTRMGTFNEPHEQQEAEDTFKAYPRLDAIVALSPASVHGVLSAINGSPANRVRVVAFDRDDDAALMFDVPNIDSVIVQDTQKMGAEAVRQILESLGGRPMTPLTQFEPVLLTRENIEARTQELGSMIETWPPESRGKWMVGP